MSRTEIRITGFGGQGVVLTGYIGVHGTKKLGSRNVRIIQDEDGTVEASIKRYLKKYGDACQTAKSPARSSPPE